ncbi:hypothetical protein ACLKA7_012209 [Drosophila subpalustris]
MPRQHDSSQDWTAGSCRCPHHRGVWLHWPFEFLGQFPASSSQQADGRSSVKQSLHLASSYLDIGEHAWIHVVVSLDCLDDLTPCHPASTKAGTRFQDATCGHCHPLQLSLSKNSVSSRHVCSNAFFVRFGDWNILLLYILLLCPSFRIAVAIPERACPALTALILAFPGQSTHCGLNVLATYDRTGHSSSRSIGASSTPPLNPQAAVLAHEAKSQLHGLTAFLRVNSVSAARIQNASCVWHSALPRCIPDAARPRSRSLSGF